MGIDAKFSRLALLCALVLFLGSLGFAVTGGVAAETDVQEGMDGSGTEADPYVVTDAEQLQAMQEDLDAHYVLGNDVDASETEDWNGANGFSPVGEWDDEFSGSFDGQGHTISGLTIDDPARARFGLFGATSEDATVQNVHLEDVYVHGSDTTGGLIGHNQGEVRNVSVSGEVVARETGGGLVGSNSGLIERAHANVEVEGDSDDDTDSVGGLVGYMGSGTIRASSATGDVTCDCTEVGGLIGLTKDGSVIDSYATGSVTGEELVGGVAGASETAGGGGTVAGTYATGSVDGTDRVGGLSGYVEDDLRSSYWDTSTTGTSTGIASGDGDATGLSTDEMTGASAAERLSSLDYRDTWHTTDEYPVLQWEIQSVSLDLQNDQIGEGQTMDATVTLELVGGRTVTASEVASYDSETAVAEVDAGTLTANSEGVTEVTASVAGYSDTAEVEVLEPPKIELVDAELQAEGVVEGSETLVTATYENTGGPGTHDAELTLDGETVSSQSVRVEPDSERTVELTWTPESGGSVALDDTEVGSLQLVEPGTVTLEDVRVPEEVAQDAVYDVEIDLANDADVAVAESVELRVGGDVAVSRSVVAESGESTVTVQNSVGEQGAATNVVAMQEQELTATTEVVEPIDVTVSSVDAPESVAPGEHFEVTVELENGGGPGGQPIAVSFGGETVAEETVQFEAGGSGSMTANVTAGEEPGELELTVDAGGDDASQTVAVEEDGGGDGKSSGLPGFGIAVALLGILGGALLARRQS